MPSNVASRPDRIASLDIFRGLNIALMIFVNEVAEIRGLPWWTHHAHRDENLMTYVDMVFPAFLLIVGMSLPFALGSRIRRGDSPLQLVWYVVLRSVALITLGLIIANNSDGTALLMHGLPGALWGLLALCAAVLVWFDYPREAERRHARLYSALRIAGVVVLIVLATLYRKADSGTVRWLSYDYPEILGLIGYTYLVCALGYLTTRRWKWAPVAWFLAFLAYNIATTAKVVPASEKWWIWPVANGSMGTLVFAGVVLTTIYFLEPAIQSFRRKAAWACTFGVAAALGGWLLLPLGLSKIRATPSWVLFTIAACCWVYTLLYWLCDIKQKRAWAAPVRAAGANTLLTYLLPDFWYALLAVFGIHFWGRLLPSGWGGVIRSLVFTALMLTISTLLTKRRMRLQL